jgi:ADP-heptose:LPS heptosyltransferase
LRRLNFHVAIDPQGLTKSALLAWLSGARTRIGFAGSEGRELSRYLNNRLQQASLPHVVDRSLELLRPLGIESPEVQFRIPINLGAASYAENLLKQYGLTNGYAVVNPGAGWNSRLWPPERFGAVAKYLGQQRSLRSIAVWAGEKEHRWAKEIVAASGGYAQLAPKTSLLELGALLERGRLFVGSDTGPMHLSVAVGTRCVSLHGPTPTWQSGPYGDGHVAIQEVFHKGTSRQRRSAGNESMLAISVERVCDACDRVLAGTGDFGAEKQAA